MQPTDAEETPHVEQAQGWKGPSLKDTRMTLPKADRCPKCDEINDFAWTRCWKCGFAREKRRLESAIDAVWASNSIHTRRLAIDDLIAAVRAEARAPSFSSQTVDGNALAAPSGAPDVVAEARAPSEEINGWQPVNAIPPAISAPKTGEKFRAICDDGVTRDVSWYPFDNWRDSTGLLVVPVMWQPSDRLADRQRDAEREHFCIRCHHKWTGPLFAEYCGDCHRAVNARAPGAGAQGWHDKIDSIESCVMNSRNLTLDVILDEALKQIDTLRKLLPAPPEISR